MLGGAAAWPFTALAQQTEKVRVIGYLTPAAKPSLRDEVFQNGLRKLGWVEGKNFRFEYRRAANSTERLAAMAQELVGLNVDLIFASSTPAVKAARGATRSIPIVSISGDPLGNGFVESLARPGGNITGVSLMAPQLSGKRLAMLKEIIPALSRVAFLAHGEDPSHRIFLEQTEEAGRRLGIRVQALIVKRTEDIDAAFSAIRKEKADALIVQPLFINVMGAGPKIVELALKSRLPAVSDGDGFAETGGLLYYGPDSLAIYRRMAFYVDKVLRGAKPADLPVEQPQLFQLVVNLKTAKALGVTIPQSVMLQAERVIE